MLKSEDWPVWVQEQCQERGWTHPPTSSPLIWRELIDRGGKGKYLGGLTEFEEYSRHYYQISPPITTDDALAAAITAENTDTLQTLIIKAQQLQSDLPVHVCITSASSPLAYHLSFLLLNEAVFKDKSVFIRLYDHPDNLSILEGVAMELTDLAHPKLAGVFCSSSMQEAFKGVSAAFIIESSRGTQNSMSISEVAVMYYRYAAMMDYCAQKDVRVVVVGCHSNTGAAVMAQTVSSIPKSCFVASPLLAMQQARSILANKLNVKSCDVEKVVVWGLCEGDVLIDTTHTRVHNFQGGITGPDEFSLPLLKCLFDLQWLNEEFSSLLMSQHLQGEGYSGHVNGLAVAVGLCQLMKAWWDGNSGWFPVGVICDGTRQGMEEGMAVSQPCVCQDGEWVPVEVEMSEEVKKKAKLQLSQLKEELEAATLAIQEHTGQQEPPEQATSSKL